MFVKAVSAMKIAAVSLCRALFGKTKNKKKKKRIFLVLVHDDIQVVGHRLVTLSWGRWRSLWLGNF